MGLSPFHISLTRMLEGRDTTDLARRHAVISQSYRAAEPSARMIASIDDALVYATVRAPATYAAISSVLDALIERVPDFEPQSVLDVGAGPGTAAWATHELWPDARLTLMEESRPFMELAEVLAKSDVAFGQQVTIRQGKIPAALADVEAAELVTAGYMLTEFTDAAYAEAVEGLWARTASMLVIVEPGRPRDYQRLMTARDWLIGQGAQIVAPCPHHLACPLGEGDWCHFSQRLDRSRVHRQLKGGALGYEDEKFSYLVAARDHVALLPPIPRVIAPTTVQKGGVILPLCMNDGQRADVEVPRRSDDFKAAKKLRWGDELYARMR